MSLGNDDIELQEILHKYFLKELNKDEISQIDEWRSESPENANQFEEARIFHLDLKGLGYYQQQNLNADSSWKEFRDANRIRSKSPRQILAYAASITVLIGAILGYYLISLDKGELTAQKIDQVDGLLKTSLSDGSVVTLNEGASLEFSGDKKKRNVSLTGEAYFEVARDEEREFLIASSGALIRVLGTKFFVNKPNPNILEVVVTEGQVLVSYQDVHKVLSASEMIRIDLEKSEALDLDDGNTGLSTFWKTRKLTFRDTPLSEAVRVLSEAYGQTVELEGAQDNCRLSVEFEDEDFGNVLEVISSTLGMEVLEDQGVTTLRGNGCE